jgi:hypothetical protein
VFELGEDLLDRVQIGRVFRQQEQPYARRADRAANGTPSVTGEIVGNDDIVRPERRSQHLLDIGQKTLGVHRSIE